MRPSIWVPAGCGCRCFHNDRCLLRCVCLTILGIPIRRIISFGRWLMTLVSKCPKWIITCIKLENQLRNGSCTRDLSELLATPYSSMFWGKNFGSQGCGFAICTNGWWINVDHRSCPSSNSLQFCDLNIGVNMGKLWYNWINQRNKLFPIGVYDWIYRLPMFILFFGMI